jgi:hypothetical protein
VKVFRGNDVKESALHIVMLWASKSASCLGLRGSNLDRWPDIRWFKIIIIIIIIIIIGVTGTISKSFRKYVSNIPGNHEVRELQKTAILGTAHILRKVLT